MHVWVFTLSFIIEFTVYLHLSWVYLMATMMDCSNTVPITRSLSLLTVYCVGNPSHLSSPSQRPAGWHTAHIPWPWPYTVSCLMGTCCCFWQRKYIEKLCAVLFGGWHQTLLHLICPHPQRLLVLFNDRMRSPWTVSPSLLFHGWHEKNCRLRETAPSTKRFLHKASTSLSVTGCVIGYWSALRKHLNTQDPSIGLHLYQC